MRIYLAIKLWKKTRCFDTLGYTQHRQMQTEWSNTRLFWSRSSLAIYLAQLENFKDAESRVLGNHEYPVGKGGNFVLL